MDQELDRWICDKLAIPYQPLAWYDVVYYQIVTCYDGTAYTKTWPKRCTVRNQPVLKAVVDMNCKLKPYKPRILCSYRMWNGKLSACSAGNHRWSETHPLGTFYAMIINSILTYHLTFEQYKELHFGKAKKK